MKKTLVIGFGKSGKAAATLMTDFGEAEVTIWDAKEKENFKQEEIEEFEKQGISLAFGKEPSLKDFDEVVLSPGVPIDSPFVEKAKEKGLNVLGELELAFNFCDSIFVAITGTNGKTTTTTLVGEMAKAAQLNSRVCGNIGTPVTDCVYGTQRGTLMITEVSSFQLESIHEFHPRVAAVLNVTPDHLDRHHSFDSYAAVKAKITANQDENDFFVYNKEDPICCKMAEATRACAVPFSTKEELSFGAYAHGGKIYLADGEGHVTKLCKCDELIIPGKHNLENALAAATIAYCSGVNTGPIADTLKSFKGVEHRMEFVCEKNGVRYVNDSKGTNPDASIKAIDATKAPIILIAGGFDKHLDFTDFISSFKGKVKDLLLIGATAKEIAEAAEKGGFDKAHIHFCKDMDECIKLGHTLGKKGDTVLLSPASASWGMYNNFEERGEHFKKLALAL